MLVNVKNAHYKQQIVLNVTVLLIEMQLQIALVLMDIIMILIIHANNVNIIVLNAQEQLRIVNIILYK